eukprot:TRINITY_DN3948_c0_g1_i3.p1 TRINITY_DN3948_c0_g1~~TRINITY_DN3948_c0_g1_i3.p1  ORF type:complete len:181 (+),score=52.64 TRINITY_DN3948_c0_g1_i3:124-666(+)
MGEVQSTQKGDFPSYPKHISHQHISAKQKQESGNPVISHDWSTSTDEEDTTYVKRKKATRVKQKEKYGSWQMEVNPYYETTSEPALKSLAIDPKNIPVDPTQKEIHGILYGRDYAAEDAKKAKKLPPIQNITPNPDFIVHKITGKETLQGLALKYGVQATDIKKLNKLWNNDDVYEEKKS